MEKSIIIERKKSVSIRSALLLFLVMLFFGFFLFLYYVEPAWITSEFPFFLVVIAIITFPISFFAIIFYIKSIFNKKPVLIVDEKGIYDQMTSRSLGLIKWDAIDHISVQPYMDKTYLIHIYLANPKDYFSKKHFFHFMRRKYGHIIISSLYFNKDFKRVMDIISFHFDRVFMSSIEE